VIPLGTKLIICKKYKLLYINYLHLFYVNFLFKNREFFHHFGGFFPIIP